MRVETIIIVTLLAIGVTFTVVAAVNVAFFVCLRRSARAVWESLGSPFPGWNYTATHFAIVRSFLRSRGHLELGDTIRRLGDAVRILDVVFLAQIFISAAVVGYVVLFIPP